MPNPTPFPSKMPLLYDSLVDSIAVHVAPGSQLSPQGDQGALLISAGPARILSSPALAELPSPPLSPWLASLLCLISASLGDPLDGGVDKSRYRLSRGCWLGVIIGELEAPFKK